MTLRVTWLAADQRARAAAVWAALDEQRPPGTRGASTWRWTSHWLDAYADVVPHRFAVVGDAADEPAGIALVTEARGRLHLGTAGEPGRGVYVEDNRVPAVPGQEDAVAAALAAALRGRRVTLHGFAPEDADRLLAALGTIHGEVRRDPSPLVDLATARGAGVTDVLDVLRPGPAKRIRRSGRAFGELVDDQPTEPTAALAAFDELVALHTARWTAAGEPGAFADPRVIAFHRAVIADLVPRGEALLWRTRDGSGETVGVLYALVDGPRVLFLQGGLAPSEDNRRRPGLTVHARLMQHLLDTGADAYDLLAGDSRSKRELATGERELVWADVEPAGLRAGARRLARALKPLRSAA